MKYTFDYFHQQLFLKRNTNYDTYKDFNESDILIELLDSEEIYDYTEIEWEKFLPFLFTYENVRVFTRAWDPCYFDAITPSDRLEQVSNHLTNLYVRVKFLLYLQRNIKFICKKIDDHDELYTCQVNEEVQKEIQYVEEECARLISKTIAKIKNDQIKTTEPDPKLVFDKILNDPDIFKKKILTDNYEEKIYLDKIIRSNPTKNPNDLFHIEKDKILSSFINDCSDSANYCEKYIIRREAGIIITEIRDIGFYKFDVWDYTNRVFEKLNIKAGFKYFRHTPAYQVMATVYVLLGIRENNTSAEIAFSDSIAREILSRNNFNCSKEKADAVIKQIITLRNALIKEKPMSKEKQNIEERVTNLQKENETLKKELSQLISNEKKSISIERLFEKASECETETTLITIKDFLNKLNLDQNRINKLKVKKEPQTIVNNNNIGNINQLVVDGKGEQILQSDKLLPES